MEEGKIRVLFVVPESEREIMGDSVFLLAECGFGVDVVDDASLAVRAEKEKYDCIVIETSRCFYSDFFIYKGKKEGDCFLEKRGIQAILDLKEKNPEQKIIVLTTNPFPSFFEYLPEITDFYFIIPFDTDRLAEKIKELCCEEEERERKEGDLPFPFYQVQ